MSPQKLFFAVAGLIIAALPVFAQTSAGTIGGRVVDATGLPVPGVTVMAQGVDLTQVFITEADGRFRFLELAPGSYRVTSALQGFATNVRENVVLDLGKHVDLPVTMQISAVS